MKFKKVDVENNLMVDSVILYSEETVHDYSYNHLLNLVDDLPMNQDKFTFLSLQAFPEKVIVSDRYCSVASINKVQNEKNKNNNRLKVIRKS